MDHTESTLLRSDGPEITASMILIGQFFGGDGAWSPRVITCFGRTFFDVALTRDRWLHHWVQLVVYQLNVNVRGSINKQVEGI